MIPPLCPISKNIAGQLPLSRSAGEGGAHPRRIVDAPGPTGARTRAPRGAMGG